MTLSMRKHLYSENLHLPELLPLIGKDVCIIVVEEGEPRSLRDISPLKRLAGHIDLDFAAIER